MTLDRSRIRSRSRAARKDRAAAAFARDLAFAALVREQLVGNEPIPAEYLLARIRRFLERLRRRLTGG